MGIVSKTIVYRNEKHQSMKIVCLKCKETVCGKIEILRFSPLTRGAGGLPPGPPERCAAQPRFFAFLVTEARRLDLIFSTHSKKGFPCRVHACYPRYSETTSDLLLIGIQHILSPFRRVKSYVAHGLLSKPYIDREPEAGKS